MVLLREVYYNTDTLHLQGALIHTALYVGTTYIYNTSTGRLQYRYIYNTDTVHLQGALIHTALHVGTTYIYNTSTGRVQYRYSTFTGRLNTYGTIRRYNLYLQYIHR